MSLGKGMTPRIYVCFGLSCCKSIVDVVNPSEQQSRTLSLQGIRWEWKTESIQFHSICYVPSSTCRCSKIETRKWRKRSHGWGLSKPQPPRDMTCADCLQELRHSMWMRGGANGAWHPLWGRPKWGHPLWMRREKG